jgi:hypothetical protein
MVDLTHGLQQRGETPPAYPVQAIALDGQVTILAVGGELSTTTFRVPGRIVLPFANDSYTPGQDPRVDAAIRQVLARVAR